MQKLDIPGHLILFITLTIIHCVCNVRNSNFKNSWPRASRGQSCCPPPEPILLFPSHPNALNIWSSITTQQQLYSPLTNSLDGLEITPPYRSLGVFQSPPYKIVTMVGFIKRSEPWTSNTSLLRKKGRLYYNLTRHLTKQTMHFKRHHARAYIEFSQIYHTKKDLNFRALCCDVFIY
jgi:hypothetical protein